MMEPFIHESLPQRVIFGREHQAAVDSELERRGGGRAVVLTGPRHAEAGGRLAAALGSRCAGTFAGAAMHTPAGVTEQALTIVRERNADVLVSLGGGSAIGLGKAIALRTGLPQIAIPTTYAGSEATPILGETADGRKTTVRDPKVLPEVVIYDVALTMTLGVEMSVTSGVNAVAHAVEALYARERNPVAAMLAEEGVAAFAAALPAITKAPGDRDARSTALFGAWACGTCLGTVGMALHHKICHVLGGTFGLPHAATHAVILPHAVAYNERAAARELEPVARVLDAPNAATGLWRFARSLGAPAALSELGMRESDLDRAVDILLQAPYWNPQPLVAAELRGLLADAFFGRRPANCEV